MIAPGRRSRVEEEHLVSSSMLNVWMSIIGDIVPLPSDAKKTELDKIQGFSREGADVSFVDRSRAYYRSHNAVDMLLVAGSAFIKGFTFGYPVAFSPRPYPVLRRLDRTVKKA